jgi:hypothetical protein
VCVFFQSQEGEGEEEEEEGDEEAVCTMSSTEIDCLWRKEARRLLEGERSPPLPA